LPLIDFEQIARVAEALRDIVRDYAKNPDTFTDPNYYPPPDTEPELVASYFLVMVAMDHRLSRPGKPYEAVVDGRKFHGADLLYKLGMKMFEKNPDFFRAENLAKVRPEDVKAWLCVANACPPDVNVRAALLRDLGVKMIKLYGGSIISLVKASNSTLHTWDPEAPGFAERLRVFEAYSDPVEKKVMLLAKFLERRGIVSFRDEWNKRVPVDNHVTRIALRLGIVRLEEDFRKKILEGIEFSEWEDVTLRIAVREAWHEVSKLIGVNDFVLDDILWSMGRSVCLWGRPRCRNCSGHQVCIEGRCALAHICPTALSRMKPLNEPLFYRTWWY
jgi:hypothetical protein